MKHLSLFLIFGLLGIYTFAIAQVPKTISYQGLLTTPSGTPVQDGMYSLKFEMFSTTIGGTALWTEDHSSVVVQRGIFSVVLGSISSFNVAFDGTLWMQVTALSGPNITSPLTFMPRSDLTSAPYAIRAIKSDSAKFADSAKIAGMVPDGTITSSKIYNGTIQRVDVQSTFKAPYSDTADYSKGAPPAGNAGGDLTGTYPNPIIAVNTVTSGKISDGTIQRGDVQPTFKAPYSDTADYAKGASPAGNAGGDLTGTYPNPTIAVNTVTSGKISDGTIQREDVQTTFKAPYSDTADYAKGAPPAGNAGGDLTGTFPNPTIVSDAVTSAKILDATIQRDDVQTTFKAPYSDTADYAKGALPAGTAGGDLTGTFPNPTIVSDAVTSAKILDATIQRGDVQTTFKAPYSDTADYAKGALPAGTAGGDLTGTYPNPTITDNSITSAKILDGTIAGSDISTTAAMSIASLTTTGNVGIGTMSPGAKLHLYAGGAANVLKIGNAGYKYIYATETNDSDMPVFQTYAAEGSYSGLGQQNFRIFLRGGTGNHISFYTNNDMANERMRITSAGNVGIGTTSPAQRLDVAGTVQMTGLRMTTSPSNGYVLTSDASGVGSWQPASLGGTAGGDLTGTYPNPTIANNAVTSGKISDGTIQRGDVQTTFKAPYSDTADYALSAPSQWTTNGSNIYYNSGNVGIGTATPSKTLEIVGSSKITDTLFASNVSSNSPLRLQTAGTTRMYFDDATSKIGIGTTSPNFALDVKTGTKPVIGIWGSVADRTFTGSSPDEPAIATYCTGGTKFGIGQVWGGLGLLAYDIDTYGAGNIQFFTGNNAVSIPSTERMRITYGGRVGIGTTNPQGALDVSSTTGAFIVPRMTTAQRDAITAINGMIIYNITTNQFNFYENAAWVTK